MDYHPQQRLSLQEDTFQSVIAQRDPLFTGESGARMYDSINGPLIDKSHKKEAKHNLNNLITNNSKYSTNYQKFTQQSNERIGFRQKTFSPDAKVNQTDSFRISKLSELTGVTLNQVRKNRKVVETDVQKLHNRIRMLQLEEERALKKIDETRKKAKQMLDVKLANDKKTRANQSMTPEKYYKVTQSKESLDKKEEKKILGPERQALVFQKKMQDVNIVRQEKKIMAKRKAQLEKANLRKNQEKRLEIQMQMKDAQERIEKQKQRKIDEKIKMKEQVVIEEQKRISKKEKQARKLELLEAEILQRLKDTHMQQKEAIQDIEKIFKIQV